MCIFITAPHPYSWCARVLAQLSFAMPAPEMVHKLMCFKQICCGLCARAHARREATCTYGLELYYSKHSYFIGALIETMQHMRMLRICVAHAGSLKVNNFYDARSLYGWWARAHYAQRVSTSTVWWSFVKLISNGFNCELGNVQRVGVV